jgi:hypothetical protein
MTDDPRCCRRGPCAMRCPSVGGPRRRAALGGLLQCSLAALFLPAAVNAAELAESQVRAVRTLIEAQLDAFAADDAERAYAYASAGIRSQFTDADTFMAMVRSGYPMVVRPASVTFFQPSLQGGTVLQKVQLRDRAGRLWRATYQLEQQAGVGWRIGGCVVVPDAGKSLTSGRDVLVASDAEPRR